MSDEENEGLVEITNCGLFGTTPSMYREFVPAPLSKEDCRLTKWYEFDSEHESVNECRDRRLLTMPQLLSVELEQLIQLRTATWDGNLISKTARSALARKGLIVQFNGWQIASLEGLAVLETLGVLKA